MTELVAKLFTDYVSYDLAREESEKIDQLLGFNIAQIESRMLSKAKILLPEGNHKTWSQALHQGNQTWVGLSLQTLQTPYSELKLMCELLKLRPQDTIVDLGAGYGRMGLVLKALYPEVNFLGYEYVLARVDEGVRIYKKFGCDKARLFTDDLTREDFVLPEAEFYFLYDYGTIHHIRKTLKQFEDLAVRRNFRLVARGEGVRSLIQYEHPWLSSVYEPIHHEQFSIYSTSDYGQ